MNEAVFEEALRRIQQRRAKAQLEYERRTDEVNRKIPPIAEINAMLAKTSLQVIDIARSGENVEARIEELRKQNLEAQRFSARLLKANGYPADYLDIRYTCKKCNDTGYNGTGYCDCLRREAASVGIARMNETAQVELSDFGSFSLEYYKGFTMEDGQDCYSHMEGILNYCMQYAEHFGKNSPSYLFYGRTGLGKTHLSLAIAREVIARGYEVIYDSVINLLEQVAREHFGRESRDMDTLELLLSADLLVLDDLGTEFDTQFNVSTVYNIINTRLNRGLPTIISTNLDFQGIRNRYEERIVSRLFAVYDTLQFVGMDIRLLKKRTNA